VRKPSEGERAGKLTNMEGHQAKTVDAAHRPLLYRRQHLIRHGDFRSARFPGERPSKFVDAPWSGYVRTTRAEPGAGVMRVSWPPPHLTW
jgi:hypothetical protein